MVNYGFWVTFGRFGWAHPRTSTEWFDFSEIKSSEAFFHHDSIMSANDPPEKEGEESRQFGAKLRTSRKLNEPAEYLWRAVSHSPPGLDSGEIKCSTIPIMCMRHVAVGWIKVNACWGVRSFGEDACVVWGRISSPAP